jgi:menaquinone-dependent protoporphyrinogen oxidase
MVMHVLVAFATKHGSTDEIAAAIGSTLRNAGLEADVRSARDVATIAPYEAVVLGSALYSAHWQRDANRLVKRHLTELRSALSGSSAAARSTTPRSSTTSR